MQRIFFSSKKTMTIFAKINNNSLGSFLPNKLSNSSSDSHHYRIIKPYKIYIIKDLLDEKAVYLGSNILFK